MRPFGFGMVRSSSPSTSGAEAPPPDDVQWQPPTMDEVKSTLFKKHGWLRMPNNKDDFKLPPVTELFCEGIWKDDDIMKVKVRLNKVKDKLDNYPSKPWHAHTAKMNGCSHLKSVLKYRFTPEFCSVAWCKFTEILSVFDIIPASMTIKGGVSSWRDKCFQKLNSVHLCEAPGAFISAMNHFVHTKPQFKNLRWNWLATTLNPYYEGNSVDRMINEDCLILHSWDHWTFLKDNTGNLMNLENIKFLIARVKGSMKKVHIVTADGSIDCQDDPNNQEEALLALQFAEVVAALSILSKGGSFVLKIFTIFECQTICSLYLLSCLFTSVQLFKPASSREGNSEVYVICLGYFDSSAHTEYLNLLLKQVENETLLRSKCLFPYSQIPAHFIYRVREAAKFFGKCQANIINRNIKTYNHGSSIYYSIRDLNFRIAHYWVDEVCQIKHLPYKYSLFWSKRGVLSSLTSNHVDRKSNPLTSHADEIARRQQSPIQKVKTILDDLEQFRYTLSYSECAFQLWPLQCSEEMSASPGVHLEKPYTNILGSRFIFGKLLLLRDELREQVQVLHRYIDFNQFQNVHLRSHSCGLQTTDIPEKLRSLGFWYPSDGSTHFHCFHETSFKLFWNTDMEITMQSTWRVFKTVLKLKEGESMFLCEFPLMTRIHVGIVQLLSPVFDQVFVILDKESKTQGVLFQHFRGLSTDTMLSRQISSIAERLEANQPTILEFFPMHRFYRDSHATRLLEYNKALVRRSTTLNAQTVLQCYCGNDAI